MRRQPASPAAARRHRKVLARAYRARLLSPAALRSPLGDGSPRETPRGGAGGGAAKGGGKSARALASSSRAAAKGATKGNGASPASSPRADDDARVTNLMRRFEGARREDVRQALDSANGHAGRAASKLRVILDRAMLKKGGSGLGRAAKAPPKAQAQAAASPHTPAADPNWAAAASPMTAVRAATGKPLALHRVGGDNDAHVLVRKVRTLCTCEHGSIQEVISRAGQRYALKVTERESSGRRWTDALRETRVMAELNGHQLLAAMMGVRRDPQQVYLLLELCTGGDLCTRLAEVERIDERATQFYAAQLCQALHFLHTPRSRDGKAPLHYIHRDIKPDNVFIAANGYLKLGDFGFTVGLTDGECANTRCGTPEYMAPEVVRYGGYGRAADYWSLGVMLYECLCGATPFAGIDDEEVYNKILKFARGDKPLVWAECAPSPRAKQRLSAAGIEVAAAPDAAACMSPTATTDACRDFVSRCVAVDPESRLGTGAEGAEELLRHPWFGRMDWGRLERQQLEPPWVPPELKNL